MGVEEIVSAIKKEAHDKANSEILEARKTADTLRKENEKDISGIKETLENELEAAIQARVGIIISGAKRQARDIVLQAKESIIQDCIDSAMESLAKLSAEEYGSLLISLVKQGQEQVGDNCLVTVTREADREILAGIPGVELAESTAPGSGGVIIQSLDRKLRINNTFEGILLRKRGDIRSRASRMLFS